jgi:hypothetical protein
MAAPTRARRAEPPMPASPTFKEVFDALRARPSSYSVPPSQLVASNYRWTREALRTVGIEPTDRDLETAFWSDRVVDLVDQVNYFMGRNAARVARQARKPVTRRRKVRR